MSGAPRSFDDEMRRYREWERAHFLFFVLPVGVCMALALIGLLVWGLWVMIS